jgi:hypothetical protein
MLDQVPQVFTIRKFPRPGHSKDIRIFVLGDQPQGLVGGKTRISDHHDLPRPCWGHKIFQHLSKKDVLMPFAMGVNRGESHGDTKTAPTHNEQAHLKTKRLRIMLTVARRMPQGMLPTALVFQCALPDEIQHSIGGRRERSEWGRRQGTHYGRRIPLARPKHAQRRPIFQRGRQRRMEPLERPFARIANQGHDQPTADQKVSCLGTAKMLLERVQRLIDFAGDACGTPHVSRSCAFWDVGYIQNTQERFVFQGFLRDTAPSGGCSPVTSEQVRCVMPSFHSRSESKHFVVDFQLGNNKRL